MINPNDPYIQYITENGLIKTATTSRWVNDVNKTIQYVVSGINEPFFLLNLFDQHKKVNGILFDNVDNLDMLAFLNSDFQSVDAIPQIAFFNAFQTVAMLRYSVALDSSNKLIIPNNITYANDYLYLFEYCKTLGQPFTISPFFNIIGKNEQILNDPTILYYCRSSENTSLIWKKFKFNQSSVYNTAPMSQDFKFFDAVSSNGQVHAFDVQIIGYKVVFSRPLY